MIRLLGFGLLLTVLHAVAVAAGYTAGARTVRVNGKNYGVQVVQASLDAYTVKVGLAQGRVGMTQSLAAIAKKYGAAAAINGCFFDAYTKEAIKPPYHNLVTDGKLIHMGSTGTTLGFDATGKYRMTTVKYKLEGGVDDSWKWPNNWYAYFMNHPAEMTNIAMIFDRHWNSEKTPAKGMQVVVADGVVTTVGAGAHAIPANGYVLMFGGGEQSLVGRFAVGKRVAYRTTIVAEEPEFWQTAREALGCGPRLVKDGAVACDPAAEGFSHPKILTMSCARSAVGVTADNTLLLVATTGNATIRELADIMRALGARDAMNLDGGASSSLWSQGQYLKAPGRDLSNALMLVKK